MIFWFYTKFDILVIGQNENNVWFAFPGLGVVQIRRIAIVIRFVCAAPPLTAEHIFRCDVAIGTPRIHNAQQKDCDYLNRILHSDWILWAGLSHHDCPADCL